MAEKNLLMFDKSFESIMEASLKDLANTPINDVSPGSVARLLLAQVNNRLATFYAHLKNEHAKAFLSQAANHHLDLIGQLLNCTRYPGESDDNYKYRISKQSLSLEKANETAIRLAALSINEVKDVIMKPYTHGTGSFSVYPVVDNPKTLTSETLANVQLAVDGVKGYGTRATVLSPRLQPVEVRARVLFDEKVANADRAIVKNQATTYIRKYIAEMKPGDVLSPDKIETELFKLDNDIIRVEIYHFTLGGKPMLLVDQPSAWNEQYVEADIPKAILIT